MGVVVVGIDGSGQSMVALSRAIEEANMRDWRLDVVYVTDVTPAILLLPGEITVSTVDVAEARRKEVWERAKPLTSMSPGEINLIDVDGYPADALVDHCNEAGADLLVLGTRGRGRIASTFLGSTSLRALEHSQCDVLIAKNT
jgi:nucleotide-binding universal stress UspA family protein